MARWLNPEYRLVQTSRTLVRWLRRLGTRIFLADLHAELDELRSRQQSLERSLHRLLGQSHDQTALSRRLAALEDHLLAPELLEAPALPPKG